VIGAVGDLVEDVIVQLGGPVNLASDTDAVVSHRRGGSAANVAVAAASIDGRARFIGAIGDDPLGDDLAARLDAVGVEVGGRRAGRTGTIVVLVDEHGERTMLSDRGSSADLIEPDRAWLQGLDALHVPFYSLAVEPIATTCHTLIGWARAAGRIVSLDVSSTAVVEAFGLASFHELIGGLGPDLVFANEDEADLIGIDETIAALTSPTARLVVHGPAVATVIGPNESIEVPAHDVGAVADSTGAGDAFAGGFLSAWVAGADSVAAAQRGHDAARDHLLRSAQR
jgi:sugar/nucleoside kinase (ribokinase family)